MTTATQTYPVVKPSLYDVMQQLKEDIFSTLHVMVPGEVVSFDGTKRTATVRILLKRTKEDGTYSDYKPLYDCPVWTPGAGGAFVQFPIAEGDQGMVIFADRNIGAWLQNGNAAPLPDLRAHNLSDGVFVPGLNALDATMPSYPTNKLLLSYQGTTLELDSSGVKFGGTGGAEIDLQAALVTIKNGTTTLLTVLNGLIDVVKALQVTGPLPLTAPSVASLEAYKLIIAGLLG